MAAALMRTVTHQILSVMDRWVEEARPFLGNDLGNDLRPAGPSALDDLCRDEFGTADLDEGAVALAHSEKIVTPELEFADGVTEALRHTSPGSYPFAHVGRG
ncbi:hypothetical protein ACFQ08_13135 [Streptosporangium algeriense]|uniref:Acyl-CoA dehydrogenase n=1 Tax=Streptosporangium algeriense TaxID=1682748 RepID=A0ABW3DNM1_9ACTN